MNLLLSAILFACPAAPQEGVDQAAVDEAIRKGVEFLKTAPSPGHAYSGAKHCDELILFTFIHAGVPESDPKFQQMFLRIMKEPLAQTYKVSLQAMCLEEIQRVRFGPRIAQCAQFLVDNQCKNGQWSYGEPTSAVIGQPSIDPEGAVATGRKKKRGGLVRFSRLRGPKIKPKVVRTYTVKKTKAGKASGDNSNTQYAALGLRACHDSGVIIPKEVVKRAMDWWIRSQHAGVKGSGYGGVRGWNYRTEQAGKRPAYGSMTAGATGSLAIYDYIQGKDFRKNPAIKAGLNWLASNFSVTQNPGRNAAWYLYYMYGLERAGILCDTKTMGKHDWYVEGAKQLLKIQKDNGSWTDRNATWGTCFAILFLKKATRPLVASEDLK